MEHIITKSNAKNKKFDAIVDGKQISFGHSLYDDYTTHKDETRKERYIARHRKNEKWGIGGIKTTVFL